MKTSLFLALTMLSACTWFHAKTPPPPEAPQLIVTGAPANSIVFIDDMQKGEAAAANDRTQVIVVPEGTHLVEVHMGGTVVYRESVFVKNGEKRVVSVLSGSNR